VTLTPRLRRRARCCAVGRARTRGRRRREAHRRPFDRAVEDRGAELELSARSRQTRISTGRARSANARSTASAPARRAGSGHRSASPRVGMPGSHRDLSGASTRSRSWGRHPVGGPSHAIYVLERWLSTGGRPKRRVRENGLAVALQTGAANGFARPPTPRVDPPGTARQRRRTVLLSE
jgi:hypothetical protein